MKKKPTAWVKEQRHSLSLVVFGVEYKSLTRPEQKRIRSAIDSGWQRVEVASKADQEMAAMFRAVDRGIQERMN